jgi:polyferredoxin
MFQYLSGPFQSYRFLISPLTPYITPYASPLIVHTINFNYPYIQAIITYITGNIGQVIAVVFVAVTLTGFSFTKRGWCRFCPTGSSLAAINRFKAFKGVPMLYIEKDEGKCNECEVCYNACPVQVSELTEQKSGKIYSSMCILCVRCVESCPNPEAIKLKLGKKTLFRSRTSAAKIPNWLKKLFLKS